MTDHSGTKNLLDSKDSVFQGKARESSQLFLAILNSSNWIDFDVIKVTIHYLYNTYLHIYTLVFYHSIYQMPDRTCCCFQPVHILCYICNKPGHGNRNQLPLCNCFLSEQGSHKIRLKYIKFWAIFIIYT